MSDGPVVHPTELECDHYHPSETTQPMATHWLIEVDDSTPRSAPRTYNPMSGFSYRATPVCDECVPRVTMGDRPVEILAIPPLRLVGTIDPY